MVIALVGLTDVIVAVDAIPAIFAITCNPFSKMLLIDVFKIPVAISLGVVVSILAIAMLWSVCTAPKIDVRHSQ